MTRKSAKKTAAEIAPSLISSDKLQQLYNAMLKYRVLEAHARRLDGVSFWTGKEAVAIAATSDLQPEDAIVAFSGAPVASFLKGTPPRLIFTQSADTRKRRNTAAKIPAAAECAFATGVTCARNADGKTRLTVAFLSEFPDGSGAEPDTLRLAGLLKLPILYVCAGMVPDAEHVNFDGLPVIPVDGSDVVAVYRVVYECMVRARRCGGPSMIACRFDRGLADSTKSRDSLSKMERDLSTKGLFSNKNKLSTIRAFEKAIAATKKAPHPGKIHREPPYIFVV